MWLKFTYETPGWSDAIIKIMPQTETKWTQ